MMKTRNASFGSRLASQSISSLGLLRSFIFASMLAGIASSAQANTYYVSNSGNNTTGATWATAWRDLALIKWSSLKAGDAIMVAGGSYAGMTVPSTVPQGVAIYQSK